MGGTAVVGSDFHGSAAAIAFELEQDLEIIPTRTGVRPPWIGMVGRVVGTLQVTDPGKCRGKPCGTADQGPAKACLALGEASLLSVNVKPSDAWCGQEMGVNSRDASGDTRAAVGPT